MYKKCKQGITTINNLVVVFTSRFRSINPHVTWCTTGGDVCIFSGMFCATYKGEPEVAGNTLNERWSTKWWKDVGGRAENEKWAVVKERTEK